MGVVVAIIVVAIIVIGAGVALGLRHRSRPAPEAPRRPPRPEPAPMTGLEDALSQVTDRSGTPMRDRLDAETDHVEQFRVTDDTGPLLRRALDQVGPEPRAAGETAHGDGEVSDGGSDDVGDERPTS